MEPIQSRNIGCLEEFRQDGLKEGNIQLLLRSGCLFYRLILEQSVFQRLQSIIQHGSVKCIVWHPSYHRETDLFLQWSQNIQCLNCEG